MATAWFIAPYKRKTNEILPTRYCAMDDFTAQILADDGNWTEAEILGNRAVVKVRASVATLTIIAATQGFRRLPKDRLNDTLSSLTNPQKNAIRNELLDQGYTLAEIQARFGNDLGAHTLADVLRFMARRRLKPRYDAQNDTIILDGPEQPCRSIDSVNAEVQ